jgi:hypothetical protein
MFWNLTKRSSAPISLHAPSAGFALEFDKSSTVFAVGASDGSVQVHSVDRPDAPP